MDQGPQNPPETPKRKTVSDNYLPKVSPGFGHIDDFWKRYDELADRSDREMVANLNTNLDVLLIFAGLFSAVNTAFISAAMPSLSPNPSDRTNALLELLVLRPENTTFTPTDTSPPFTPPRNSITANCFLYASLCCSLIAAMGAMLAKEWLQSYSRSGQAGPLEEQVRFRLGKYNAAQEWHLESVILFLPNLLILSVLLFFAGLTLFLFPVNSTVGAVVIAFFGVGMALSTVAIVAGAVSPFCPYQTAISRALRRTVSLLVWSWGGLTYLLGHLTAAVKSKWTMRWIGVLMRRRKEELQEFLGWRNASVRGEEEVLSRPSSLHVALSDDGQHQTAPRFPAFTPVSNFVKEWVTTPIQTYAQPFIRVFHPDGGDATKQVEAKARGQHITNAQAANWLLEMTSSLKDQLTVAQNICCIDPTACDILSICPGIGDRLLSLTVEAIHACQSQPSDKNLTTAEQFGTAFYHVMLCYPRNHELWNQLRQRLPVGSFLSKGGPMTIFPELANVLQGTGGPFTRLKRSHSFRKVILHNMIVNFDDRWALEGRHMLIASYDDAILSLLALQISLRIGKHAASMDIRIGQDLQNLATQAYIGDNLDTNLADALPALATYIVSKTSHYPLDKTNAAFICIAFLERIKLSIDQRGLSPLLRETLSSCLLQLLSGFETLGSQGFDVVQLSMVAIGCFRALRQSTPGSYDAITMEILCNTLQYAVIAADRSPKLADSISLDEYLLESLEWVGSIVIPGQPTLRSEMRKYPRIIARMAMALKASPEVKRRRWIMLISRSLTELVDKRNLSVWEDAELGTHAVGHLRRVVSYLDLTNTSIIIRHLISLSVEGSTELLAAKIVDVIAEVSKNVNRWPLPWDQSSRKGIYMELLDLMLKVWDAALRSRFVRSICWPTDSTLDAMGILLPHVDKLKILSPDSRVNFNSLPKLPLLVDYLRKRKPEAPFIARNLDVSINSLFDRPESGFGWGYLLYTDQRPSSLCAKTVYIDNEHL